MNFWAIYNEKKKLREDQGIPPLALNQNEVKEICEMLQNGDKNQEELINLLQERVNPGVDEGAKVKAQFLDKIINENLQIRLLDAPKAIEMLQTMLGGYNTIVLTKALENTDENIANLASLALSNTIFIHDDFNKIANLAQTNRFAKQVLQNWANATNFTQKPDIPALIKAVVFKVNGEINTDDLSPASEAYTRSDIPLHALSMLQKRAPNSLQKIAELKKTGLKVVFVGDVVGTGSSRKSAINSLQWHLGTEISGVPNKKTGCIIIGSTIAPIFFNTAQDSGAMPIIADVSALQTGDVIEIYPFDGIIAKFGKTVAKFSLLPLTLKDEIKAGGRINLILMKSLCEKARNLLNLGEENIFIKPTQPKFQPNLPQTLAQKIVAKACNLDIVAPGMYVEPETSSVGSQDTTGPMTRDEIKELASLKFNADFVLQSFCHTAAYPKNNDIITQETLPEFMISRNGVALRPGDGVIHSWLNRMILPDCVGTGGDSHTRFPLGISFPAGSGLVAFAAVTSKMPLNMPKSILVKFSGTIQEGITLRDLVNAIPYFAIKKGLLSVEKTNKKNIFAGKILEISGLENLKVEQAFELSDASAERSAAACAIALNTEPVCEYIRSNVALIDAMIDAGYENRQTLLRRKEKMQQWLENPSLLTADENAQYEEIIEIDMNEIKEPILACPNDPDDVATLSEILTNPQRAHDINEVFIGSCMTNIGHFRALGEILRSQKQIPTRLWIVPPTKMDSQRLRKEGYFSIYAACGARIEVAGCSLCMGNQARVADNAVVFSTSTRNFDNRMGMGAKVYLGSAELGAICAILGKLPKIDEYLSIIRQKITPKKDEIYTYLNFNEMKNFSLK